MKYIKYLLFAAIFTTILIQSACSDMDEYLKYTDGGEIIYTGKVDSVIFRSGENRVVFNGLLISDPKIRQVKVYWNNRKDSLTLDIDRTSEVDTIDVAIPLVPGDYNFEVFSIDTDGRYSLPVKASGSSYGDEYRQSLYNRLIKTAEKINNDVIIEWYNPDEFSPFVEVRYTNQNDELVKKRVYSADVIFGPITILENHKMGTYFEYQTYFLPDPAAIDTFLVEVVEVGVNENITKRVIKNPGAPFLRADNNTGKWGLLKDWMYTPNIINQVNNTLGGWSTDGEGVIHLESRDWGGDGVTNGKIYQTIELPAGDYSLEFYSDGGGSSQFEGHFLVVEGAIFPDITNIGTPLAHDQWNQDKMGGTRTLKFTLAETKSITIGWVASFGSSTWMHINHVKLINVLVK